MASADCTVNVWDLTADRVLYSQVHPVPEAAGIGFQMESQLCARFSPGSNAIATFGNHDEPLKIWDKALETELHPMGASRTGMYGVRVAFIPDTSLLLEASSSAELVHVWDLATGTLKGRINTQGRPIGDLQGCAARPVVVVGYADGGLELWDLADLEQRLSAVKGTPPEIPARGSHEIAGHRSMIDSLSLSSDGRYLATLGAIVARAVGTLLELSDTCRRRR